MIGRQGKPYPPYVRQEARRLKQEDSQRSAADITLLLTAQFPSAPTPDKSTVSRWLSLTARFPSIPTPDGPGAAGTSEDPYLAKEEHWPNLKEAARELARQVAFSVFQLMPGAGPDKVTDPEWNQHLALEGSGPDRTVRLAIESDLQLLALREHLSAESIWRDLDAWKECVLEVERALATVVESLRGQLPQDGLEAFAGTAIHDGCLYALKPPLTVPADRYTVDGAGPFVVRWVDLSMSRAIASCRTRKGADQRTDEHLRLARRLSEMVGFQGLPESCSRACGHAEAVRERVEWIVSLPGFSGRCSLWEAGYPQ